MNRFSVNINVKNTPLFPGFYMSRIKCYIRKAIHEFLISRKDENVYFSLDEFCSDFKVTDTELVKTSVKELIPELVQLGWKCTLSYGDTGLFIYSTEKPPKSCWHGDSLS